MLFQLDRKATLHTGGSLRFDRATCRDAMRTESSSYLMMRGIATNTTALAGIAGCCLFKRHRNCQVKNVDTKLHESTSEQHKERKPNLKPTIFCHKRRACPFRRAIFLTGLAHFRSAIVLAGKFHNGSRPHAHCCPHRCLSARRCCQATHPHERTVVSSTKSASLRSKPNHLGDNHMWCHWQQTGRPSKLGKCNGILH